MHIFLYIRASYFMCQCTEYKLLELQVRLSEENTYTQRYDTAVRNCKKISGGALKQGSKTHSSIRQSNLQRKNTSSRAYEQSIEYEQSSID